MANNITPPFVVTPQHNKNLQLTKHVLLVRPANFMFNEETAGSNKFQHDVDAKDELVRKKSIEAADALAHNLEANNVQVVVIQDTPTPHKPDAVFPNNWITMHADGTVILYPMQAENRRLERRPEILDQLREQFYIKQIIDLSHHEQNGKYLEGTGSIVFDHNNKVAYACLSLRTDKALFIELCKIIDYKPIYFHAYDPDGKPIYHTNVMMCLATHYAAVCLESITDIAERNALVAALKASKHTIIELSYEQIFNFAGNMLELQNSEGNSILALSKNALDTLTQEQIDIISQHSNLVATDINAIETIGGGSVRCMIAEIFLPKL